mmetsp:Transcript_22014/g.61099  ORF Transcript_22014/g.61099 Transcript_22014/m.61099 type:complete len:773 (+) Transcript_22014:275-2593(+)
MENYNIMGMIGQGQYGTAHKVAHVRDGKLYCMKRIPMSKHDDANGAMREAHLLSTLNHPNVLGYKESFLHDGALCIVTHYCEEGDLFTLIQNHAKAKKFFSENEIMEMFLQIAMGLHHIHSKRVLHRDLKTQNIFVARGGILKLGDFGISKVLEKTDEFATTVTGTPYYMAPEICKNEPYSLKSDIWSLGCVLYELCTLKHAFAADSLLSLVYQIVKGNFPPIPQDKFSADLSRLVQALLHTDTQARPTLKIVFDMPYVEQHKQRFMKRQQQKLSQSRRADHHKARNRINEAQNFVEATGDNTMGGSTSHALSQQQEERALTPAQRARLRKQQQADQRAMELKVASINMNQDRGMAKNRKSHMIQGSTSGAALRLNSSGRMRNVEDTFGDSTVLMGSVADGAAQFTGGFPGPADHFMGTDEVNLGSVNFGSQMGTQQYGGGQFEPTGASVLMGSVTEQGAASMGMRPSSQSRPRSGNSNFQFGIDMNAPSTPLHFSGSPGSGSLHDEVVAMSSTEVARNASRFRPGSDNATGGQKHSTPSGPVEVGGFRFGVESPASSSPGTPSQASQQPRVSSARSAISAGSRAAPAGHAAVAARSQAPQQAPPRAAARRPSSSSDSDIDDEVSDDEYSDDFEDYSDDFEEDEDQDTSGSFQRAAAPGTPKVAAEREAMMRNLRQLDYSGMPSTAGSQLAETVPSQARHTKMDQLRARCRAALGKDFDEVYRYLKSARQSYGYGDDEKLKNRLIDMVGRRKLSACFETDQLVFQELLQQDY